MHSKTVQFKCIKNAQKTELNVLWYSTGSPSGFLNQFCVSSCDDAIVVSTSKLSKLWDSLSELCSSLCER
jgi:hypothetical protein